VWVQIESAAGVECADAIAALPGVDAIVVGTADLSFSLGAPLDTHAPELLDAVEAVRRATVATGVALGIAGALDTLPVEACAGASILVHSTDARICADAVDRAAEWLRVDMPIARVHEPPTVA
jgi:2-keto-3-deoxy-L-rhamnonate aldolase RhmA